MTDVLGGFEGAEGVEQPPQEDSNQVKITGIPANIEAAKVELMVGES